MDLTGFPYLLLPGDIKRRYFYFGNYLLYKLLSELCKSEYRFSRSEETLKYFEKELFHWVEMKNLNWKFYILTTGEVPNFASADPDTPNIIFGKIVESEVEEGGEKIYFSYIYYIYHNKGPNLIGLHPLRYGYKGKVIDNFNLFISNGFYMLTPFHIYLLALQRYHIVNKDPSYPIRRARYLYEFTIEKLTLLYEKYREIPGAELIIKYYLDVVEGELNIILTGSIWDRSRKLRENLHLYIIRRLAKKL